MRVFAFALLVAAVAAKLNRGLRGGVSDLDEEAMFYERFLEEEFSSYTSAPTPCSNLIEYCPLACWEMNETLAPPRCTDLNRTDCNVLPFPGNDTMWFNETWGNETYWYNDTDFNMTVCPDCCPDVCLDSTMEACDPTPLPSPAPTILEDDDFYNNFIDQEFSSYTSAPTPCSNLIEYCPLACWEMNETLAPPRCTDLNRTDCNVLPFPGNDTMWFNETWGNETYWYNDTDFNMTVCPDCCPDVCLDSTMEACDPTPLPSPAPSAVPLSSEGEGFMDALMLADGDY